MNPKPQTQKINKVLGLACAIILSAASVKAADRFWSGGTASYNSAASWGGTLPGGGDNAINNSGAANTVLISATDPNWTINDIRSGDGGANQGPWLQTGANVTLNGWFRLGIGTGTGKYEMSGGTLTVNAARFNVGEGGTAVFNFTGGTITKNGGGDFAVPDGGTGVMNQTNGTLNIASGEFWVGQGTGANGTYNLSGNGSVTVNSWIAVGRGGGTGTLNLSNNASITKTGTGTSFIVGAAGTGTLNQTGGAATNLSSDTWLGENGTGVWNMSAGSDTLGFFQLGRNGGSSGTFNLNGGTLAVNQIAGGAGTGILNFNGGTLQARVATASFMSGVAGNLQAGGATIDSQAFNVTISSILADAGGGTLTKLGSGTLTLAGANSYTGSTTVSAGKLIEGTASTVTSAVTVANTAGYGVSVLVANGQVSHGNVTLSGAANTLDFLLGNFGNPALAPLNVTSVLNVNGTTTVNITDALPQVGQFPLISYLTKTGAGTFALGTLPAGVSATLSNNVANSSIDLVISSTALIRWDGQVAGGIWDINTTTNWTDYITTLPAKFTTGAAVFFDDLALGTTNVNLGVTVAPGSVTVTNNTLSYVLYGVGKISGATSFVKQGTNSFTIANTNTYTGPTVISGGQLSITNIANGGLPSAIGQSSSNSANLVLDGGKLSYSGPAVTTDRGYTLNQSSTLDAQSDMTFNGPVSPTINANFAKTGNGTLSIKRAGVNTLSIGGGGAAYNIVNGAVVMDGSIGGGQTNSITGELWAGGTTNSTGGNLVLTNTTLNLSSWLAIARGTGTGGYTSSVSMYNSALRSGNMSMGFDAGIAGTLEMATLTMNGTSTFTNNGDSNLGESSGGTAIVSMNDSSVFFGNNRMMVGWHTGAIGAMTVANSAKVVLNAWISIGNEGGVGSVLVKDSGSLYCGDLNVCDVNAGQGDLVVTNAAAVKANAIFVGKGAGSIGNFTQSGGTVSGQNGGGAYVEIGSSPTSSGTINLNAGTFLARQIRSVPNGITNGATSTFNFNGGLLVAAADLFQNVSADFLNNLTVANVLAGGLNLDSGTNNIRITQPLLGAVGDGGLTKAGSGSLLLNGVNTYTNTTLVTAGSLSGNGTIAGPVIIQASGNIGSSGNDGIRTLTINNNLTFAGNVVARVNTSASPSNDLVVVTGTLNKTGTGTVSVSNVGTNALQAGQSFKLFSQPVVGGGVLTVSGGGAVWTNKLAIDGSIQVVSILAPPNFTAGGVTRLPDGNISLTATGTIGSSYRLWATTNLVLTPITTTWTLLNSGTVTTSPFTNTDLTATNFAQRFYIFSTP